MSDYLSDAWFERYATAGAELPTVEGADATITYEVGGGPDGKVRWNEVIESGRIVAVEQAKKADADIAITWKYDEAVRLLQGETTFDASFMEGRTKVEGDYVRWILDLRSMRDTPEFVAFLAEVAPG
ncbi:MAG: SCP2 sterol-binding domain-containing protein [Acidimicrobiia bacterium]|nr:SCP2 sterol-binding domain-containing protein [Acidimicrobiia bacterium]